MTVSSGAHLGGHARGTPHDGSPASQQAALTALTVSVLHDCPATAATRPATMAARVANSLIVALLALLVALLVSNLLKCQMRGPRGG